MQPLSEKGHCEFGTWLQDFTDQFFHPNPALSSAPQVSKYRYLDGMQTLLGRLKAAGYPMHAMSNYPSWYRMIEDKLQPSQYLSWTFISCEGPMRVRAFEGSVFRTGAFEGFPDGGGTCKGMGLEGGKLPR